MIILVILCDIHLGNEGYISHILIKIWYVVEKPYIVNHEMDKIKSVNFVVIHIMSEFHFYILLSKSSAIY